MVALPLLLAPTCTDPYRLVEADLATCGCPVVEAWTWSNGGVRPAGEPIVTVWDVEFLPTRMPVSWDLTGLSGEPDAVMRRCLLAAGADPGPGQENLGCVAESP